MSANSTKQPLAILRRRLTIWYAGTLGLILLLLGGGLYLLIHAQIAKQLDDSLGRAAKEIMRAAQIREMEAQGAKGTVVDAVEELHIPDRQLFILDSAGNPITPRVVHPGIRAAARVAAASGVARRDIQLGHDRELTVHAERFRLESGQLQVAVAAADELEIADRYAALIAAFSGIAVFALVLSTVGGYFLLQQAIAPAEKSISYTRRFMADAAHELRTPISVLRTKAEVALQTERTPEHYAATLRDVDREAQRLGRIVDDLLILARADAGVRPISKERFFLDDIALDAAQSLRTLAQAANVSLEVTEFVETPVLGDAPLVRELIVILLDNAVKFTPPGGSVHLRVTSNPQPVVVVEDSGVGISAEDAPHVFERFFRGDASRKRDRGAGLGLSIAQWIASIHDARITLAPRAQGGTIAIVAFPRVIGR